MTFISLRALGLTYPEVIPSRFFSSRLKSLIQGKSNENLLQIWNHTLFPQPFYLTFQNLKRLK